MRQGKSLDEAIFSRKPQDHHDLARIMRVSVDHDVAADDRQECLEPLVDLRRLTGPSFGVSLFLGQIEFRLSEVVVSGCIPAHHGLRCLAWPQIDKWAHCHLQVHIGLKDHAWSGRALHLQGHGLAARNDSTTGAGNHRGHTPRESDLDHRVLKMKVLNRFPFGCKWSRDP